MTVRAVLLGLLAALALSLACYFNDFIMRQTFLVGNYMPISVYGGLLVFLLVVNPLLLHASKRLVLSGRELAVIVALTLAACYVPGRGLMHYFCTFLMLPHHYARTTPGWKEVMEEDGRKLGAVDLAPEQMLAGVSPRYREDDLLDGPTLCSKLVAADGDVRPSPARRVWERLPKDVRATAREVVEAAKTAEAQEAEITAALDHTLRRRDLHTKKHFEGLNLPDDVKKLLQRGTDSLSAEEVLTLNKALLAAFFPKAMAKKPPSGQPLAARDVADWPLFCSRLRKQGRRSRPSPGRRLWELLPERIHATVGAVVEADAEARARHRTIIRQLNRILQDRGLYDAEAFSMTALPTEARELLERGRESLSRDEVQLLNRRLLDAAFPQSLRSLGASEDLAVNGFVQGLGVGDELISPSRVPWHAWTRALGFWLPLLISFSLGMVGLAMVVHRQWSDHEQLPYPIVTFASSLLPGEGQARGGVFGSKLFWIGAAIVLFIHMNNYSCTWWPRYLVRVPVRFDFRSLTPLFPALRRGGDWHLMNPTIYFTAVGFAFFLATDVSLSLGIAPYLYSVLVGTLAGYGVTMGGGGFISLNIQTFLFGGAYFGMFLVLIYTGRHYYVNVFRRGVCLPTSEQVERHAVWGARVFLVGAGAFALQLALAGLPWYLAAAYTVGAVLIFTVISRVVSETGVFYIHAYHFPCVLLWGFAGARVLGPRAMLIMFMVTSLLLIDPREAVMPFMVHAFRLVDVNRVRVGRTATWGGVALLLGFAVAVPMTIYWSYAKGSGTVTDGWTRNVPKMAFDATVRVTERLEAQGNLADAGKLSGWAMLKGLTPNKPCVLAFGISMGLVLLFAAGRLRFPRWPLHPVMFLVLGTYQSRTLGFSFLLGCVIKVLVTKYGGASAYQKLKPLMIGVIAGDMLGGLLPMVIGLLYYLCTGEPPKQFKVLP